MSRSLRLLVVAVVSALAAALLVAQPSSAIVGGRDARDGEFRFMASIQYKGSSGSDGHFCGGSVIAKRWVLTAAHCMEEERPRTIQVAVGRTDLEDTGKGQTLGVDKILVHPKYAETGTFDAALIKTKRDMRVPTIALVPRDNNVLERDGSRVRVSGWGSEFFVVGELNPPSRMKTVALRTVGDANCTTNEPSFNAPTEICAEELGGDACQGDSGGPLFGTLASGRRVQIGIVSYGWGCATPGFPGVYGEVNNRSITGFIKRNTPL